MMRMLLTTMMVVASGVMKNKTKNDVMRLKDRIRDAILKGINESFDVGDMGIDIVNEPGAKQKVAKHSKNYCRLQRMLSDGTIPAMPTKETFLALSADDREFISSLYRTTEDDVAELMSQKRIDSYIESCSEWWMPMQRIIDKICKAEELLNGDDLEFYGRIVRHIHEKDDILCGYYPVSDNFELRSLVIGSLYYLGLDANLNWIDVSRVTDMS